MNEHWIHTSIVNIHLATEALSALGFIASIAIVLFKGWKRGHKVWAMQQMCRVVTGACVHGPYTQTCPSTEYACLWTGREHLFSFACFPGTWSVLLQGNKWGCDPTNFLQPHREGRFSHISSVWSVISNYSPRHNLKVNSSEKPFFVWKQSSFGWKYLRFQRDCWNGKFIGRTSGYPM